MGMDQYIFLESEERSSGEKKETEICYWRRFYRLHNFIFEELGGRVLRNEEGIYDAELTADQLDTIRRFVLAPEKFAEGDYCGSDPYENADEEEMLKMKEKWDTALTKCIETVKKNNENKDSPRLRIIYSAGW